MSEYTKEYVEGLRMEALLHGLDAPQSFWEAPIEVLVECYNGCGPDWMSKWGRKALTFALRVFEPAILIHDYQFSFSDGTTKSFNLANNEFYVNCKKLAKAAYDWFNPLRYKWLWRAFVAWRACVRGGWSAWLDGHNEFNKITTPNQ